MLNQQDLATATAWRLNTQSSWNRIEYIPHSLYGLDRPALNTDVNAHSKPYCVTTTTPLLRNFLFLVFPSLLSPENIQAEPASAISDDGREIQLNDDGSLVDLSEDRFATTAK